MGKKKAVAVTKLKSKPRKEPRKVKTPDPTATTARHLGLNEKEFLREAFAMSVKALEHIFTDKQRLKSFISNQINPALSDEQQGAVKELMRAVAREFMISMTVTNGEIKDAAKEKV